MTIKDKIFINKRSIWNLSQFLLIILIVYKSYNWFILEFLIETFKGMVIPYPVLFEDAIFFLITIIFYLGSVYIIVLFIFEIIRRFAQKNKNNFLNDYYYKFNIWFSEEELDKYKLRKEKRIEFNKVKVSLTNEEATKKIKQALDKIYRGRKSGRRK